jgi:hypothetical protein
MMPSKAISHDIVVRFGGGTDRQHTGRRRHLRRETNRRRFGTLTDCQLAGLVHGAFVSEERLTRGNRADMAAARERNVIEHNAGLRSKEFSPCELL